MTFKLKVGQIVELIDGSLHRVNPQSDGIYPFNIDDCSYTECGQFRGYEVHICNVQRIIYDPNAPEPHAPASPSKREQFAVRAMGKIVESWQMTKPKSIARTAVGIADAMIAELDKEKEG